MQLLSGKETAERLTGIINPKYQVHATGVDLTVKQVFELDPVGKVDFGGGEYTPAGPVALQGERLRREDRYEWWDLPRGCYLVEFNEAVQLNEDEIALIEPDQRLIRAGASHAAGYLRGRVEPILALLDVGLLHVQVKQNARISRLRVFRITDGVVAKGKKRTGRKKKK